MRVSSYVGRTITGVVATRSHEECPPSGNPNGHIYLVFSDQTNVEIWSFGSGEIYCNRRLQEGGLEEVRAQLSLPGGDDIVLEAYLQKDGRLAVNGSGLRG